MVCYPTREQTRVGYRTRLRALRVAGRQRWVRRAAARPFSLGRALWGAIYSKRPPPFVPLALGLLPGIAVAPAIVRSKARPSGQPTGGLPHGGERGV